MAEVSCVLSCLPQHPARKTRESHPPLMKKKIEMTMVAAHSACNRGEL
jgi:hypothetical protein